MSNDNTSQYTEPSYGGDVDEPSAKKSFDEAGNLSSCLSVHRPLTERSLKESVHGWRGVQNSRTSPSEVANIPTQLPVNAVSDATADRNGQAIHKKETLLKGVGFTSTSFIGPLCHQGIKPKTNIEDELDHFYKELEHIEPKDVDKPDDCNADRSTLAKKQQYPVPQQQIQPDLSQPMRHPGPHTDQLSQNLTQNFRHLPPYYQCWDVSYLPALQGSDRPIIGFGTRSQRPLYRFPSPFLPPPLRIPPYPLGDGSRANIWCPNQESFQWGNVPLQSGHTYQRDRINHAYYQDHYELIPNDFGCNEPHNSNPDCSQPYRQTSFLQTNSEEFKLYQQAHTHPGQIVDPGSLKLILMRGAPGSGKSTLARELLSSCPHGLILSTDDYFLQEDHYVYDARLLGDAHHWNQSRTREALRDYCSPIIIDNTNMQAWEMKPYVQMAVERGYIVCFCEPNTSWKYEPSELERRNKHGVPKQKIEKILERFEQPMTVDIVLNSQEPPRQSTVHAFKQGRKRQYECF
ncbi:NEDD4-binding protein 2-like 2 [Sardina pilchardus]|uniref:NEDD4-binding protein 2-like 2 n=1 Tax=Sardina pilchardus TaxID=27697 RepID=UPI002E154D1E